jgi:hypothetical protein
MSASETRFGLLAAGFHQRLAETIAWCSLQELDANPPETEEFRQRANLAARGVALYRRAELIEKQAGIRGWLSRRLPLLASEEPKKLRREGLELIKLGNVADILPLNNQLRTPELRPEPFVPSQNNRPIIVEALCAKRAQLIHERDAYPRLVSSDLAGGKLLIYEPDNNFDDGASQEQSKGYFDGKDAPPWDTWLCYSDRQLISWVPPSFLDLVQAGIATNPVDCVRWVEDSLPNNAETPVLATTEEFDTLVKPEDMTHP